MYSSSQFRVYGRMSTSVRVGQECPTHHHERMGLLQTGIETSMPRMRHLTCLHSHPSHAKHFRLAHAARWLPALRICVPARERIFPVGDLGLELRRGRGNGGRCGLVDSEPMESRNIQSDLARSAL